jgi:hypothetical protein
MNEIPRPMTSDRWQAAQIHEESAVAVERNYASFRELESNSER